MVRHKRANGLGVCEPSEQGGEVFPAQRSRRDRGEREARDDTAAHRAAPGVDLGIFPGGLETTHRRSGAQLAIDLRLSLGLDATALPSLGQLLHVERARRTTACHMLLREQGVQLHGGLAFGLHSHHRGTSLFPCELSVARGCLRFVDQQ